MGTKQGANLFSFVNDSGEWHPDVVAEMQQLHSFIEEQKNLKKKGKLSPECEKLLKRAGVLFNLGKTLNCVKKFPLNS